MESFLAGVFFVGVVYLIIKVSQLQEDVQSMRNTLGRIENQMDLPENPINDHLRVLLEEGKDVEAVKVARETLGLSLLEGKQYIDALSNEK